MKNSIYEKKILVVHNYYRKRFRGGEDIVFDNEVKHLKSLLKNNLFLYYTDNENMFSVKKVLNLPFSSCSASKIRRIIKHHSIDIVHFHNVFYTLTPSVISAAKNAGAKVIITVHNFRWWCPNGAFFNPTKMEYCNICTKTIFPYNAIKYKCLYDNYLFSLLMSILFYIYKRKSVIDCIDKFIVLSNYSKQELMRNGISSEKILVKPNFTNIDNKFSQKKKSDNYIYIGRLDKYKGFEMLMDVWSKTFNNMKLHIVGNGPLLERYSKLAKHNHNIIFYSKCSRQRVSDLLKEMNFMIMPSLMNENFPLTILEAISSGVPVISTDIGMREEIIRDGENGFLYTPDKQGLKKAILRSIELSEIDYEKMIFEAYNTSYLYKPEIIMNKLIEIYKDI